VFKSIQAGLVAIAAASVAEQCQNPRLELLILQLFSPNNETIQAPSKLNVAHDLKTIILPNKGICLTNQTSGMHNEQYQTD
jgi:hypothetical protein